MAVQLFYLVQTQGVPVFTLTFLADKKSVVNPKKASGGSGSLTGLQDTLSLLEAMTRRITHAFSETIGLSETLRKRMSTMAADTLGLTETMHQRIEKTFSETLGLTENLGRRIDKTFSETIGLSEALGRVATSGSVHPTVTLDENLVLSELQSRLTSRIATESLGLTEQLSQAIIRTRDLSETIGLTETTQFGVEKTFTELLALLDHLETSSLERQFDESIALSENLTPVTLLLRSLSESVDLTEVMLKSVSRRFAETVQMTEQFSAIRVQLTDAQDTLALTEQLVVGLLIGIDRSEFQIRGGEFWPPVHAQAQVLLYGIAAWYPAQSTRGWSHIISERGSAWHYLAA